MFDKSPQFQYEDIQLIQVRAFPVAHAIPWKPSIYKIQERENPA